MEGKKKPPGGGFAFYVTVPSHAGYVERLPCTSLAVQGSGLPFHMAVANADIFDGEASSIAIAAESGDLSILQSQFEDGFVRLLC